MLKWRSFNGLSGYLETIQAMEDLVEKIADGKADEEIWLLEHPALYTAGTSAKAEDLKQPNRFNVFTAGRGGQYTYHGPGQRVIYLMLDVTKRGRDVRKFVRNLETWVIATLEEFNIRGERRDGRVGIWVSRPGHISGVNSVIAEDKIAAIGIKLRRWVSFHGISINVEPDLEHFSGIIPCGIHEHGVTSLVDLGLPITMEELDLALKKTFPKYLNPEPDQKKSK